MQGQHEKVTVEKINLEKDWQEMFKSQGRCCMRRSRDTWPMQLPANINNKED